MSIETLKAALPDYAKDLKLNLATVLSQTILTPQQIWGTVVASAIASRNAAVRNAVLAESRHHLSPEAFEAAKTSAAVMAMNNIYYRFVHLVGVPDYGTMPARLRMNGLANPPVDRCDFELWAIAVSAINGCGKCLESHEHEVIAKGATREMVQGVVKIAAVISAVATILDDAGVAA